MRTLLRLLLLSLLPLQSSAQQTDFDIYTKTYRGDTLLSTAEYLVLGDSGINVVVIEREEATNYPNYISYKNSYNHVILLDRSPKNQVHVYKRYQPLAPFEDYLVDVYQGVLKEPNFETNPKYKRFITRIINECKEGINFAGHYTMVTWGCGSPCQRGAIVDRKTGKIYDGIETTYGVDFRKNSNMVVKNEGVLDRRTNLIEIHGAEWYELTHILWNGKKFEDIQGF